ncbi:GAF and ANTAR domain-containing protein [Mumia zhuanghuii]|uniref:GAF and ANTAR domain-containing protein n=1 Tax=Mumia zhuanghuii TaxID=2585211 RepID=UPI0018919097|nr:GAF and ANTAR domain-containing protein [Mumia zhuanghuii]
MDDDRLDHHELAGLVEELHAADTTQETAEQVIKYLCEILEMDHAAVTMIRGGGRLDTVAATAGVAVRADELQVELGEGPCLSDSWDQTLRSGDLSAETRWPRWTQAVADMGLASLLGVSLSPDGRRMGVVTLYSKEPRFFDDDDAALAHVFARHASLALAKAEHQANLVFALDARKLIGQAQGILMERFGLDDHRAFEVLRRYSQHHNLKLRAVAEMLVSTRNLPTIT